MAVEETIAPDENIRLAALRFKAVNGDAEAAAELKTALIARNALPFYKIVATELVRPLYVSCRYLRLRRVSVVRRG